MANSMVGPRVSDMGSKDGIHESPPMLPAAGLNAGKHISVTKPIIRPEQDAL